MYSFSFLVPYREVADSVHRQSGSMPFSSYNLWKALLAEVGGLHEAAAEPKNSTPLLVSSG